MRPPLDHLCFTFICNDLFILSRCRILHVFTYFKLWQETQQSKGGFKNELLSTIDMDTLWGLFVVAVCLFLIVLRFVCGWFCIFSWLFRISLWLFLFVFVTVLHLLWLFAFLCVLFFWVSLQLFCFSLWSFLTFLFGYFASVRSCFVYSILERKTYCYLRYILLFHSLLVSLGQWHKCRALYSWGSCEYICNRLFKKPTPCSIYPLLCHPSPRFNTNSNSAFSTWVHFITVSCAVNLAGGCVFFSWLTLTNWKDWKGADWYQKLRWNLGRQYWYFSIFIQFSIPPG